MRKQLIITMILLIMSFLVMANITPNVSYLNEVSSLSILDSTNMKMKGNILIITINTKESNSYILQYSDTPEREWHTIKSIITERNLMNSIKVNVENTSGWNYYRLVDEITNVVVGDILMYNPKIK
jgi:predicted transcriptional regulator with HTH domain